MNSSVWRISLLFFFLFHVKTTISGDVRKKSVVQKVRISSFIIYLGWFFFPSIRIFLKASVLPVLLWCIQFWHVRTAHTLNSPASILQVLESEQFTRTGTNCEPVHSLMKLKSPISNKKKMTHK